MSAWLRLIGVPERIAFAASNFLDLGTNFAFGFLWCFSCLNYAPAFLGLVTRYLGSTPFSISVEHLDFENVNFCSTLLIIVISLQ